MILYIHLIHGFLCAFVTLVNIQASLKVHLEKKSQAFAVLENPRALALQLNVRKPKECIFYLSYSSLGACKHLVL